MNQIKSLVLNPVSNWPMPKTSVNICLISSFPSKYSPSLELSLAQSLPEVDLIFVYLELSKFC